MTRWSVIRPYVAGLLIAGAVVASVLLLRGRDQHETLITIEPLPDSETVTVFVGGAVARPGVYTLQRGDRVDAAIAAAGGLSDEADPDGVNRALKLRDEAQIIVPRKGAPRTPAAIAAPGDATPATTGATAATSAGRGTAPGKLDVNTASAAELEQLPGVGPHLAQQIVEYRTANGPFATAEDLAKVKGISERMVAGWAELITFGP